MRDRSHHLKSTYALTVEDFEAMFEVQGGVCAICGLEDEKKRQDGTSFPLSVDHDHETSQVRGLLCSRCNMALGLFRDSPEVLASALDYIRLWKRKA